MLKNKVVGDPVTTILKTFSDLYPKISVQIAYMQGIDSFVGMPPKNKYEAKNIFNINPHRKKETSILALDERDWTTGTLMSLMRRGEDFVILLDWEATIADNVAILLEILPRLVTNDYCDVPEQFEYKTAKHKLITAFNLKLDRHYELVLPRLIKAPDNMQVLHTPFTELQDALEELDSMIGEGYKDDDYGDDMCSGGVY